MNRFYNFSLAILVSILVGVLAGCFSGNFTRAPESKPLPPLKSNLPNQLPLSGNPGIGLEAGESLPKDIISQADFYAQAVASGNWVLAKNLSTEGNKLLLEQQIKPQLTSYWRQWQVKLPPQATVNFEDSLLIKEDFENQIVIESLEYPDGNRKKQVLYLQFQITKVGDKYLIDDTLLLTTAKIFPGA